jgi:hypothetical protein
MSLITSSTVILQTTLCIRLELRVYECYGHMNVTAPAQRSTSKQLLYAGRSSAASRSSLLTAHWGHTVNDLSYASPHQKQSVNTVSILGPYFLLFTLTTRRRFDLTRLRYLSRLGSYQAYLDNYLLFIRLNSSRASLARAVTRICSSLVFDNGISS